MWNLLKEKILIFRRLLMLSLMGLWSLMGQSKVEGLTILSRCKSRECGFRVSYCSTLKLYSRRHLYRVYTCYVKRYYVSH